MDALMICLVACAIAGLGGRWWLLVQGMARRLSLGAVLLAMLLSIAAAVGLAATAGGTMALTLRGPGMLLFLALALLSAGAGLCWPAKPVGQKTLDSARGPISATILLLAAMVSDSAPFIILAESARTGTPILAGLGALIGLIAAGGSAISLDDAMVPLRLINRVRAGIGILFLIIGAIAALSALQLL